MNRYDLEGKVAIVTGGAGGIGRAIARLMLDSGATVALWDAAEAALREAADALGARVSTRRVDVTAEDEVAAAAEAERAAHGRIDILVNNAGILGAVRPVWEIEPADFRRVLAVNLTGAFLCTRAVLPAMLAQPPRPRRGSIVNIASIQAKEGMPLAGAYSASKAGLIALTKSVAKEVARDGIVVAAVTPAAAETAMAREITAARRQEILQRIPMGRFVEVEEIARMVTWLASDDCSFSTGAVFDVSGGRATW